MKLDGYINCESCGASAHDVIDERRGEVRVECCFCGATEWCKAPQRKVVSTEPVVESVEFRFKFGRFAGKTLSEADSLPHGRQYLQWMATNNDTLRDRVAEYLKRSVVSAADSIVSASAANPSSGE